MKTFLSLTTIVLIIFLSACSNKTEDAIKYNDQIISKQQIVVQWFNKLDSSFTDTINQSYKTIHQQIISEIKSQFGFIDSLPAFDKKEEFKNAYKELLSVYDDVIKNDYQKMIDLYSMPDSLYTQNVKNEFLQTNKFANEKLQNALNKFIDFQKQFASNYKFNLQEE